MSRERRSWAQHITGAVFEVSGGIDPPEPAGATSPGRTVAPIAPYSPNSRAISIRWTSLVPSPISRILESRHILATGYSFMKP
ncbi:hypothetical protein SSPS47_10895 [Streptomyces sp. S4.7]|nr:hypothetical protein SSPS47_10895 [Streptomyces sp. S4.7]